eukprot:TRINITY_DN1052_c0_g1_i11.p1 TRINITY_DN1052_c0_g1~~TRINITY_DN1052_c0_g1_i11.p1  ORF type:complete len:151 (-),score=12.62 TRINITY_DN1052_c0_g1_i11:536-988(-)
MSMQEPAFILSFLVPRKTTSQVFLEHCRRGDTNKIEHLCDSIETEILQQGMRIVCENGHHDLLLEFLRLDITNPTRDANECWMGWTLLHYACEKGQLRIARSLMKEGWSLSKLNLKVCFDFFSINMIFYCVGPNTFGCGNSICTNEGQSR